MKRVVILFIFIFLLNSVYALDCQYTQERNYTIDVYHGYNKQTSEILKDPKLDNIHISTTGMWYFELINENDFELDFRIVYKIGGDRHYQVINLKPREIKGIDDYGDRRGEFDQSSILFEYYNTSSIYGKWSKEPRTEVLCKECNGKTCLNDGSPCQINSECGGTFCIKGICTDSERCYNNDCKCNSNEIQCDDNKRCVMKNSIAIDTKTICEKNEECVTGYLNPVTKLCAKSPSQIQKEKEDILKQAGYVLILLVLITLGGSSIIWFLKNKNEKERQKTEEVKQRTIQKEIELEGKKIQRKEYELNELSNQIKEIERQKHKTKEEIKILQTLKSKRNGLIQDIENQWVEITKPFPDAQASNRLVVINPYLGGYKCFYEKSLALEDYPVSSLVHRQVWKKHNGRYPRQGYHIHHIDEDKYNNDPRNLEEVEGEEHYEKHRNK